MHPDVRKRRTRSIIILLSVLAAISMVAFMTLGAKGSWSFILSFRGAKLAALVLIAYSIAVSTVLFQTVMENRIVTPSIMGFDALYVLIQTVLVFAIGAGRVSALNPFLLFIVEAGLLLVFSILLYRWILSGAARSPHLLMLVGIVFGILFRSLSSFLQRILDPSEFLILQALAARPGVVKTRDALMDAAYDDQVYVDDRTIDSHIKRLRKKFKQVDEEFDVIETLYGVGYRFKEV